jgi:predicted nucleic acid-binding protein
MTFVLDASVALAWALPDERHSVAEAALERLDVEDGVAPALWWFELRNALVANERRGRLDPAQTGAILQNFARLPIGLDRIPDEGLLLDLARRHRLTVYDAAYLELATRRGLTLATLDKDLQQAATAGGVSLLSL